MYNMDETLIKDTEEKDDIFCKEIVDTFFGSPKGPSSTDSSKVAVQSASDLINKLSLKKKRDFVVLAAVSLSIAITGAIIFLNLYSSRVYNAGAVSLRNARRHQRFLHNGIADRNIIETFAFDADARIASQTLKNSLMLVNTASKGSARVVFNFYEPRDLSSGAIYILGKSASGSNNAKLILKDSFGRERALEDITFPPKWESKEVKLSKTNDFDLKSVKGVAVEYGSGAVNNTSGATIYIKEFGFRKRGGLFKK